MELIAKNISFKYPSAKKYLLQDVNLELDNKKYKTNANGVLEEYEVPPVDDDFPF